MMMKMKKPYSHFMNIVESSIFYLKRFALSVFASWNVRNELEPEWWRQLSIAYYRYENEYVIQLDLANDDCLPASFEYLLR